MSFRVRCFRVHKKEKHVETRFINFVDQSGSDRLLTNREITTYSFQQMEVLCTPEAHLELLASPKVKGSLLNRASMIKQLSDVGFPFTPPEKAFNYSGFGFTV